MGRISILNDSVIDKIAAGEVVERPASVVKELVENAIDAGATRIEVGLELGGTRRISVQDNGCGMAEDDARLALRRHATSKIRESDDLFRISTMGFRGEALAAIASVSRLSLATRETGAVTGIKLQQDADEAWQALPWNGPEGTTINVEQLFYNVPVRAKFLKSPASELGYVQELMQALALCHPRVALVLTHNGRELMRAPALSGEDAFSEAVLRARLQAVLGAEMAANLLFLRQSNRFGTVVGLISPPGIEKATGKGVHVFVNGRPVKDRVLRFAILRGYHSHLLKGRHPVTALYLQCDPALVDVNVHPAKTEVRFQYPDEVQSLISLAIRERLRDPSWSGPVTTLEAGASLSRGESNNQEQVTSAFAASPLRSGASFRETTERVVSRAPGERLTMPKTTIRHHHPLPAEAEGAVSSLAMMPVSDAASLASLLAAAEPEAKVPAFSPSPTQATLWEDARTESASMTTPRMQPDAVAWDRLEFLGAFARCYLFFATQSQLLVIDQHAFHERIIYERLLRDRSLLRQSQPLLVPEAVELDCDSVSRITANRHFLEEFGFSLAVEGPTSVTLTAVPAILARAEFQSLLAELVSRLPESGSVAAVSAATEELSSPLLATFACHAAVRAGEELGPDELARLLAEAKTVDFYHNCPHGRRVLRWFAKDAVAGWFDR